MKSFLLRRFAEPSTWLGALAVASAFGLDFNDTQATAIATFGALLCAVPDRQHG